MADLTRRSALLGGAGAVALLGGPGIMNAAQIGSSGRIVVIGAGTFGAWTAQRLMEAGNKVLLLDAWGAAHNRASSGGESRLTRAAYGDSEIYSRMAVESLVEWKRLSAKADLPLFHETGVLFFFPQVEPYFTQSVEVHERLGLASEVMHRPALQARFPMIDFSGVEVGLYEPQFGPIMARRAIQTLVANYVPAGGLYERASVTPPGNGSDGRLDHVLTADGRKIEADAFVFACGPWLPKLFPDLLGSRIFPTRQEVFFFAPEAGDERFGPRSLPAWADFNSGDLFYGFPDLEGRGFKIAHDLHGPPADPDTLDRRPTEKGLAEVRAYMEKRFPALAKRPMAEARVCQYENSANGDFLIDFHPRLRNVLLVGAGSGHGFKHGPAVGRYAADLLTGTLKTAEPRFSLATKAERQARAVH